MNEELTKQLAEECENLKLRQFIPDDMRPEEFDMTLGLKKEYSLLKVLDIGIELYNPNPHIRTTDCFDCVQRAFCKLLDKSWDVVYQELFKIGFTSGFNVNSINTITKYAKLHDYVTIDFGEEPCGLKLGSFLARHKYGRIGVSVCGHMFAYVGGIIYDTRQCVGFVEEIIGEDIRFIVCKPDELSYSDIIKEYQAGRYLL